MSIAESGRKQAPLIESGLLAFAGWYRKQREIRQSLNIFDGIDQGRRTLDEGVDFLQEGVEPGIDGFEE